MKKSLFVLALICLSIAGCKKDDGGTSTGEDLSYIYQTYYRYESGGHTIKYTKTYDGHKQTSYKYYYDGLLTTEYKNYSYDGLKVSFDSYNYQNGDANNVTVLHYECEYLDDTYLRVKYSKSYDPDLQNIGEVYYWYDGKKTLSSKSYSNGVLTADAYYSYDGLYCSYTRSNYSSGVVYQKRNYEILYLDETYLRKKSSSETRNYLDADGNITSSHTIYYVYDYEDETKPVRYQRYYDGKLSSIARDYHYDGLNCYYFVDSYNNEGEVTSTSLYEVEYLE